MRNLRSEDGKARNVVAERLRLARTGVEMTQDQLSGQLAAIGVLLDRVAITKIEGGTRCVFDFELRGLAQVLKLDPRWLLGLPGGTPPVKKKPGGKGRGL